MLDLLCYIKINLHLEINSALITIYFSTPPFCKVKKIIHGKAYTEREREREREREIQVLLSTWSIPILVHVNASQLYENIEFICHKASCIPVCTFRVAHALTEITVWLNKHLGGK